MKFLYVFFFFISSCFAGEGLISFGQVQIGEDRLKIELRNWKVKFDESLPLKVAFVKDSVQWVRDESNLLIPRARLRIYINEKGNDLYLKYKSQVILPQMAPKGKMTDLYINLFSPGEIEVLKAKETFGKIQIYSLPGKENEEDRKLIDYSCSRFDLKFEGLENDYLSVGCRLDRIGKIGNEKPRLIVTWTGPNYKMLDGSLPPFKAVLLNTNKATMKVIDGNNQEKEISIQAKVPKRLYRLKTAFGFGPYQFKTTSGTRTQDEKISPALFFYGRYDLFKTSSIRVFDAFIFRESKFNNGGVYFAYQLADALDGRLELVPLLGAQVLTFKYDDDFDSKHKIIYPQGFELSFKNAFGIENYSVTYGMFLDGSSRTNYKNLWVRWGKGYFWELNYIEYGAGDNRAKMYGLSIGLPLMQLF